jgi:Flp pilus assembly protein TadG
VANRHTVQAPAPARRQSCLKCERGASALEFALVAPIFCILLLGITSWGGYLWMSHSLQQLVNDSARAAVGGLDATERSSLAQAALTGEIKAFAFIDPAAATMTVQEADGAVSLTLRYNATGSPFFAINGLMPMPSPNMSLKAASRLGGY